MTDSTPAQGSIRAPSAGLWTGGWRRCCSFCLAWLHLLALSARSARLHPEDDQGYLIFIVQAPQGASLTYTRDICGKAEEVISRDPEIEGVFTIVGFGASGSSSNQAILYASLRPFENRKGDVHSAAAAIARLRGSLSAVSGAIVVPFNPPAVQGLGQSGDSSLKLEDLGRNSLQSIAQTANKMAAEGNVSKDIVGLFTSFTANDRIPWCASTAKKAKSLQVPLSQITNALQVYMGSVYVNDFDFNNRSYRVYVQADSKFRSSQKTSVNIICAPTPGT